jgi:hypothetical protein
MELLKAQNLVGSSYPATVLLIPSTVRPLFADATDHCAFMLCRVNSVFTIPVGLGTDRECNHLPKQRKKTHMQVKVLVTSDRPDEYVGKKGLVKNQVITCQDMDQSGYRLLMPFDYTLSEDEKAKYAGKLQDKQIVIGVRELMPFGGRLRARGAIVIGPDPKA